MKKLLLCTLLLSSGFFSGYVANEYGDVKARMTKFADLYECCSGAAMSKARYAANTDELAEVAVKGHEKPLTDFDLHRLISAWRHATEPSRSTASKAGWVTVLETESFGRVDALLKEGELTRDDVIKLSQLFEAGVFSGPVQLTPEQEKQMQYLLKRSPDLAIVFTAAQATLNETVRRNGTVPLDLASDPMVNTFRSPFDLVALCHIRPEIVTEKKNSTFQECVSMM